MSPFQWWLVRIINQYLHIFGGKFSQHFLAQNWADSSSHSLSISTFSPDTQRIQNRVRKAVCFFNKCNNDLTRYKSLGSDCETANKFHDRQEVDFSVQKNDPCVQVHPGQHNQDGGEGLRHHRGELLQHRQHHPIPFFTYFYFYFTFSSIKRKISHNRIKWQCHEIFGLFSHESNLPGPLINRLKWFC